MKCLVTLGSLAGMGGAERQALYLIEHLKTRKDYDVEVLAFEEGAGLRPALRDLRANVHVIPYFHLWPSARRRRALMEVIRLLRFKVKPDALLPFVGIHSKTMGLVWPYSSAKYCWWNQQDEGRGLPGTRKEKDILEKMSDILSNSYAGKDFLVSAYGLKADSVLVYNNGTPLPDSTASQGIWRAKLGASSRPIVTMLANISPHKDHSTLLKAWRIVLDAFAGAETPLLILAGSTVDAPHVAKMKALAFDLGLSAGEIYFTGSIDDVNSLLSDTDVLVHSSILEGCPNSVCEGMAMARPVVATNIPGCRQALGSPSAEWLAAPYDAADLAQKTLRLLENPGLRKDVGDANRMRIKSDFSIDTMNEFFVERIERGVRRSVN